jgi:hypothetical protein
MAKNKCEHCEDAKGLIALYLMPSDFKLLVKKLHLPSLFDEECKGLAAEINEAGYPQLSKKEVTQLDNDCKKISLRHFELMKTMASSIAIMEVKADKEAP